MLVLLYIYICEEIFVSDLLLFFFCNVLIYNAINSFFVSNPIHSLFILIMNYSIIGLLFIYNGLVFIGFIFMLIYIGAVSVLLLFTLMLLNLKFIYYKSINIKYMYYYLIFSLFIQFAFFFVLFKKNTVFFADNYLYINWFKIVFLKGDYVNIGYDLFYLNSSLILIIGLFLLSILIASVNIITPVKTSKKQEIHYQLKDYNKNIFL